MGVGRFEIFYLSKDSSKMGGKPSRSCGFACLRRIGDIRKVLDRAAVQAGIEEGRRHRLQHRLRDTCATTLLDAGVPLDRVQLILGHRDIGMTRRYAETRPEALRDAIAQTLDQGVGT